MFTMAGLENALRSNPDPLLQFAALKDFSGENVSFLTHVADWKRAWFHSTDGVSPEEHRHEQFVAAVRIYSSFVSLQFSEFPINISSREMKRLFDIFEPAANMLHRNGSTSSSDSATPFDALPAESSSTTDLKGGLNLDTLGRSNLKWVTKVAESGGHGALEGIEIPEAFTTGVFDTAESEIKYLVLTNTWPKFVNAGCSKSQLDRIEVEDASPWRSKLLCWV